jgi:putative RecB family exonuclease
MYGGGSKGDIRKEHTMNQYSHSRISAYETCPKKFELAYVRKIETAMEPVEAFLGKRVHEALQWLYAQVRMTKIPSEDALLEEFRRRWEECRHDGVALARADLDYNHYLAVGEKELRTYFRRHHPFDGGVIVGLEQKVEFCLDDEGRYPFIGYIDRVMKIRDGEWEIHDYKTSTSLPSQAEVDGDRQLALYHLGLKRMYPDVREVTLVFHYLFSDEVLRTRRTPEQLEALRREVIRTIDAIESCREFPAKLSALCDWCEFRSLCPAHDASLGTCTGKGADLVDRYMEVIDSIARLEMEKDSLSDSIIAYARERSLSSLTGRGHRINVWRYKSVNIPGYDDPRRRDFERILKNSGQWERFSQLNQYAFAKAVDDGSIPKDVLEGLDGYITRSDAAKLYSKRL